MNPFDTKFKLLRMKRFLFCIAMAKGDYIKTIWGMGYKFEVDKA